MINRPVGTFTPERLHACAQELLNVVRHYNQSLAASPPVQFDARLEHGFYVITAWQDQANGTRRPLIKLSLRWSTATERDLNLLLGLNKTGAIAL